MMMMVMMMMLMLLMMMMMSDDADGGDDAFGGDCKELKNIDPMRYTEAIYCIIYRVIG